MLDNISLKFELFQFGTLFRKELLRPSRFLVSRRASLECVWQNLWIYDCANMLLMTFIYFAIRHRMALLRMLYSMTLTYIFKVKMLRCYCDKYQLEKCKHYRCHQIGSQVFASELRHCYCCTFSGSQNFKCEYLETTESWRKMLKYNFYKGWYLPSFGTNAIDVIHDLDLHFHGQTFSCYAFAIKIARSADVFDRFASTLTAAAAAVELLLLVYFLWFYSL